MLQIGVGVIRQKGDTIIEVILAVALFSMIAIGALSIMNKGLIMAQNALEITLVRQQIDSQAYMLRYVHNRASEGKNDTESQRLWNEMKYIGNSTYRIDQLIGGELQGQCPSYISGQSFVMSYGYDKVNISRASYQKATTFAKVEGGVPQGISIQAMRSNDNGAYDFYIQACWEKTGSQQVTTIGTIVRLYDAKL